MYEVLAIDRKTAKTIQVGDEVYSAYVLTRADAETTAARYSANLYNRKGVRIIIKDDVSGDITTFCDQ